MVAFTATSMNSHDEDAEPSLLTDSYIAQAVNYRTGYIDEFKNKCFQLEKNIAYSPEFVFIPRDGDKPSIPTMMLGPRDFSSQNKYPVVIYVHGGPNTYVIRNKSDAELMYLAKQGFIVLAPNFYGSVAEQDEVNKNLGFVAANKDELMQRAADDIYQVAKWSQTQPYIDGEKIILKGLSFGANLISYLLTKVGKGQYENIFAGAHLASAGFLGNDDNNQNTYFNLDFIPSNIPLLVSHGLRDNIRTPNQALNAMEVLLLSNKNVQVFISKLGGHHIIDDDLDLSHKPQSSYEELNNYFSAMLKFYENIKVGLSIKAKKYDELVKVAEAKKILCPHCDNLNPYKIAIADGFVYQLADKTNAHKINPINREDIQSTAPIMSASEAYLQLVLGDKFKKDHHRENLLLFLQDYLRLIAKDDSDKIYDAELILQDHEFIELILSVYLNEIDNNNKNPQLKVQYHANNATVMKLYSFASVWRAFLSLLPHDLSIKYLRIFDYSFSKYDHVNDFLQAMDKQTGNIYNNRSGFAECAIASNFSLFGNHNNEACSTLWWFFSNLSSNADIKQEYLIEKFLQHIYYNNDDVKRRLNSYLNLFSQFQTHKDGGLLQLIMDESDIDRFGYLSEAWGWRTSFTWGQKESYSLTKFLSNFQESPTETEARLQKQRSVFRNPNNRANFHLSVAVEPLQARQMVPPEIMQRAHIYTFVKDETRYRQFLQKLTALVTEDLARLLYNHNTVAGSVNSSLKALDVYDQIIFNFDQSPTLKTARLVSHHQAVIMINNKNLSGLKEYYEKQGANVNQPLPIEHGKNRTPLMLAINNVKRNDGKYKPQAEDRDLIHYLLSLGAIVSDKAIIHRYRTLGKILFGLDTFEQVFYRLFVERFDHNIEQIIDSKKCPHLLGYLARFMRHQDNIDQERLYKLADNIRKKYKLSNEDIELEDHGDANLQSLLFDPVNENDILFEWFIESGAINELNLTHLKQEHSPILKILIWHCLKFPDVEKYWAVLNTALNYPEYYDVKLETRDKGNLLHLVVTYLKPESISSTNKAKLIIELLKEKGLYISHTNNRAFTPLKVLRNRPDFLDNQDNLSEIVKLLE